MTISPVADIQALSAHDLLIIETKPDTTSHAVATKLAQALSGPTADIEPVITESISAMQEQDANMIFRVDGDIVTIAKNRGGATGQFTLSL